MSEFAIQEVRDSSAFEDDLIGSHLPGSMCDLVSLYPSFLDQETSFKLYEQLRQEQCWPENSYEMAGRRFQLPRLQTWHADEGIVYSYSNNLLKSRPWTPTLLSIKQSIETLLEFRFNAVLVNYYRDGNDHVGWHTDNEKEMGKEPVIASLSLGATRLFQIKAHPHLSNSSTSEEMVSLPLQSGTLLVMKAGFQERWLHRICCDPVIEQGRINLTLRRVLPPQH